MTDTPAMDRALVGGPGHDPDEPSLRWLLARILEHWTAAEVIEQIADDYPEEFTEVAEKFGFDPRELSPVWHPSL